MILWPWLYLYYSKNNNNGLCGYRSVFVSKTDFVQINIDEYQPIFQCGGKTKSL